MTLVVLLKGYLDKKGFNDIRICANNLSFQNLKDNPSWTKMFLLFLFLSISQFSFYFHRAFCSLNSFFFFFFFSLFPCSQNRYLGVVVYQDSNFAGCLASRKSTFGYIFLLAKWFIFMESAKQTSVAALIIEAKFISCFEATSQAI